MTSSPEPPTRKARPTTKPVDAVARARRPVFWRRERRFMVLCASCALFAVHDPPVPQPAVGLPASPGSRMKPRPSRGLWHHTPAPAIRTFSSPADKRDCEVNVKQRQAVQAQLKGTSQPLLTPGPPTRSADPDRLDVAELPDALRRELPAVARGLHPAEGELGVRRRHAVDEHRAGGEVADEAFLLGLVVGPGVGAE